MYISAFAVHSAVIQLKDYLSVALACSLAVCAMSFIKERASVGVCICVNRRAIFKPSMYCS